MSDYKPSEETLRAVQQARIDQEVEAIKDALGIDDDGNPKNELWSDIAMALILLSPLLCGVLFLAIVGR